jgi:hypothetical protein
MVASIFYFTDDSDNSLAFPTDAELQIIADSNYATLQWMDSQGVSHSATIQQVQDSPVSYGGGVALNSFNAAAEHYFATYIPPATSSDLAQGALNTEGMTGPLAGSWTADSTPPTVVCEVARGEGVNS